MNIEQNGLKYIPRIAEKEIKRRLASSGAVLIIGPRYCGKTTTATFLANSVHSFDTDSNIAIYSTNPRMALKGESPVLIDEWQNIPVIHDEVRSEIDKRGGAFGQYILTGSSVPTDYEDILHPGIGRFSEAMMYPLSLYESGDSSGLISLSDLFKEGTVVAEKEEDKTLLDVARCIVRGGWPSSLRLPEEASSDVADNYVDGLIHFRSKTRKDYLPNPELTSLILRSYARNVSSEAAFTKIMTDIEFHEGRKIDDETLTKYLKKLRGLYILKDVEAWNPNFRSKTVIRKSPTRQFIDPSLPASLLGMGTDDLFNDIKTFGFLFESLCIRDLRIYGQDQGYSVSKYRDSSGLEIDAVLHNRKRRWAAIEIKLGLPEEIEKAAQNLLKLKEKSFEGKGEGEPAFLAVLTGAGPAYTRADGVFVLPITMLKP